MAKSRNIYLKQLKVLNRDVYSVWLRGNYQMFSSKGTIYVLNKV